MLECLLSPQKMYIATTLLHPYSSEALTLIASCAFQKSLTSCVPTQRTWIQLLANHLSVSEDHDFKFFHCAVRLLCRNH